MTTTEAFAQMTEDEKGFLRKQLEEEPKPYQGENVSLHFPKKENLSPTGWSGAIPRKGDIIYIGNYGLRRTDDEEKQRDFLWRPKWKVKACEGKLTS